MYHVFKVSNNRTNVKKNCKYLSISLSFRSRIDGSLVCEMCTRDSTRERSGTKKSKWPWLSLSFSLPHVLLCHIHGAEQGCHRVCRPLSLKCVKAIHVVLKSEIKQEGREIKVQLAGGGRGRPGPRCWGPGRPVDHPPCNINTVRLPMQGIWAPLR